MIQSLSQIGVDPGAIAKFYWFLILAPLILLLLILVVYLLLISLGVVGGTLPRWYRDRPSLLRRRARIDRLVIVPYDQLTPEQIKQLFSVRHTVFVCEQQIWSEPDRDGRDPDCLHVLAIMNGTVVGTCRLMPIQQDGRQRIKVGRLAVLKPYRKRGVGRAIMSKVNAALEERAMAGVMHAQAYLEAWYASLGWVREGEPFLEAGIEHIKMRYTPPIAP